MPFQTTVVIVFVTILIHIICTHGQSTTIANDETMQTTTEAPNILYLTRPLNMNEAIKIVADGFTIDPDDTSILYTVTLYAHPHISYPDETRTILQFEVSHYGVRIKSNYESIYMNDYLLDEDMYLSTDPFESITLEFKLTSSKWEIYYQGSRVPQYDWIRNTIGNISHVVTEFLSDPEISIDDTLAFDTTETPINDILYLNRSINMNEAIKILADGFTGDPDAASTLYTVTLYAHPHILYPDQTRYIMRFEVRNYGVTIKSNYGSIYSNNYLSPREMYLSADSSESIRLEFKLTRSKWEFYYQGSRLPDYDWSYYTMGNVTHVVTEFLINPMISIEDTAGIDFSVDINTPAFIVTTIMFIIISLVTNAVVFYCFYWRHRSGALEAPAFDPYLQEIVVPLSVLIEDFLALSFEDPGKSMNINITTLVIVQFVCLMVVSWFRECLSFSIHTKRIGSLLVITLEYVFAILFISLSRSPVLAGFVIGGLTIIQIIAEIIYMMYVQDTDDCFCIPSVCRFFAPQSLDSGLSNEDRLKAIAVGCCSEGGSRALIIVIVFHVIFFIAGCVYVENGECYGDGFKYLWVLGMFLFSKVMESKFDSANTEKWEKWLMSAYLAALELFVVIVTIYTWNIDNESDKEECQDTPLFVYAGAVMIVWIILISGIVIYKKAQDGCL